MPTITPLPPAPNRGLSGPEFVETADAFLDAMIVFADEVNAIGEAIEDIDGAVAAAEAAAAAAATFDPASFVALGGAQTITGVKTFSVAPILPASGYGSGWNGDQTPAPKDAVYDVIQALAATIPSGTVNTTGDQTIGGTKTFSTAPVIPASGYGPGWNGSQTPAPKDAVYDAIEALAAGMVPLASGTYTPNILAQSDCAATVFALTYLRVGNAVTVAGKITIQPSVVNEVGYCVISVPVPSSFSNESQAGGVAISTNNGTTHCAIKADVSLDGLRFQLFAGTDDTQTFWFNATYQRV